jgi:hypothetical protein
MCWARTSCARRWGCRRRSAWRPIRDIRLRCRPSSSTPSARGTPAPAMRMRQAGHRDAARGITRHCRRLSRNGGCQQPLRAGPSRRVVKLVKLAAFRPYTPRAASSTRPHDTRGNQHAMPCHDACAEAAGAGWHRQGRRPQRLAVSQHAGARRPRTVRQRPMEQPVLTYDPPTQAAAHGRIGYPYARARTGSRSPLLVKRRKLRSPTPALKGDERRELLNSVPARRSLVVQCGGLFVPRVTSRCWASRARCGCATLPTLNDQESISDQGLRGHGQEAHYGLLLSIGVRNGKLIPFLSVRPPPVLPAHPAQFHQAIDSVHFFLGTMSETMVPIRHYPAQSEWNIRVPP